MSHSYDVIIIGAGIAGLRAALELEKFDLNVLILEKEERAGGRIKTDEVEGFRLDQGFQVYLDAYPEGQEILDYDALDLKPFQSGALCFDEFTRFKVLDTSRRKQALPRMFFSPVGSFMDKIRIGNMAARVKGSSFEEIFERPEHTTLDYLEQNRFSPTIINRFFKPFYGGIFLENGLETSSRFFEFTFKMFAEGMATIPAKGMESIPIYMKNQLKKTEFRFHSEVKGIVGNEILLEGQDNVQCDHIIIAMDPGVILDQVNRTTDWRTSVTYYFVTDKSPLKSNIIALNYNENALVNNFTVLTETAEDYAPKGNHLVSVSLKDVPDTSVEETTQMIKTELSKGFGSDVQGWRFLRNYHIKEALPTITNMRYTAPISETRIREGIYVAGDHFLNPSINGALLSGKLAAQEAVLQFDASKAKN